MTDAAVRSPASIEWLSAGGRRAGTAVDVGCGTGKVAALLRDAGWEVIGIEPDERMAAEPKDVVASVEVARFEDWMPSVRDVDLVCSGQAWHWVDTACGPAQGSGRPPLRRAHGGVLELVQLRAECRRCHCRGLQPPSPAELLDDSVALGRQNQSNSAADLTALERSRDFHTIELRSFEHSRRQTVGEWLEELRSHALHHHLEAQRTDAILAALEEQLNAATDGSLTTQYETVATTAIRA